MRLGTETVQEEATALAAQIWCRPENEKRQMDVVFAKSIAESVQHIIQQRDAWIETANQSARNADYWRKLYEGDLNVGGATVSS